MTRTKIPEKCAATTTRKGKRKEKLFQTKKIAFGTGLN